MELRQLLTIIWKWLWLIVLAAVIAGGTSFLVTYGSPKIYQASTTLMIGAGFQAINPNPGELSTSQQLAQTYVVIAKTTPVLKGVVDALKLPIPPEALTGNVSAAIIPGTQIIELRVNDSDPVRAKQIADEYAHQLILQGPSDSSDPARRDFIQQQIDDLEAKITDAQKKIDELQKSIGVTASAREIADKQQQVSTLQTQVTQWQSTYANLRNSLSPRGSNILSVFEYAKVPTSPISPNVPYNVLIASVIGAACAIGAIFLIEYIDDTLKTSDDVSSLLGLPCLGSIAFIWGDQPNEKLIALRHPRASHSEAYRALRTNIEVANLDNPPRVVLVTSSNPAEGKSVTASNLAIVMADTGQPVLLIDADMRRPFLHKFFRVSNDGGLREAIMKPEGNLDALIKTTDHENLAIMTAGALPPNPAELLGSKRMQILLNRLKEKYTFIVFDTPPSLPRADAIILSRLVDGVIMVVDANRTRRETALHTKEGLERGGANILGVVINRVVPQSNSYYYYYYYSDHAKTRKGIFSKTPALMRAFRQLTQRGESK